MTTEVYTVEELSQIMGVSRQSVVSWQQNNQIPAKAMTPEGTFIKSVIDPFIEIYKRTPPDSKSNQHIQPMSTEQNQKRPKNFPLKVRKEALRLVFEEKLPLREVADRIGCSVNSIQSWKKKYKKSGRRVSPASTKAEESVTTQKQSKEKEPQITYEDFVRNYWSGGTKAVDVLLLSPEIAPEVIRYVNEALQYAYDRLSK